MGDFSLCSCFALQPEWGRGLCPSFAPSHLGLPPKGRQRACSSKYVDIGAKCLEEYFIFQPTSFQNLNHERVFSWVRITLFIPAFSVPAFAVIYTHSKGFHMKRCSCQSFHIYTHTPVLHLLQNQDDINIPNEPQINIFCFKEKYLVLWPTTQQVRELCFAEENAN